MEMCSSDVRDETGRARQQGSKVAGAVAFHWPVQAPTWFRHRRKRQRQPDSDHRSYLRACVPFALAPYRTVLYDDNDGGCGPPPARSPPSKVQLKRNQVAAQAQMPTQMQAQAQAHASLISSSSSTGTVTWAAVVVPAAPRALRAALELCPRRPVSIVFFCCQFACLIRRGRVALVRGGLGDVVLRACCSVCLLLHLLALRGGARRRCTIPSAGR